MVKTAVTAFSDLQKIAYEALLITSRKTCFHFPRATAVFCLITTVSLLLAGCLETAKKGGALNDSTSSDEPPITAAGLEPAGLNDLDLGQDWTGSKPTNSSPARTTFATEQPAQLPRQAGSLTTSDQSTPQGAVWMVVLGTFAGDNHREAARNMAGEVRTMDPLFRDTWVHETERGSVVGVGRFDSADDPKARQALETARSVSIYGRPVFARAILSRVTFDVPTGAMKPYDLRAVRRKYPNIDPLYTLDVAVWMADDEGTVRYEEAQSRAEAYAQQLRAQGYEAYFHHNLDKRVSTVTVGLFDHRAIDPEAAILSDDVMQLRDRFAARLVNGEALNVPKVSKRPDLGVEVQRPFLVLVPDE